MARVSTNMIHVENFLCFIKLRGGTLFSLYFTMIFSFFVFLLIFNTMRYESSHPIALIIEGIMIIGIFISGCALLYFPEMNKKYKKNSINVKCIKYFSIFCGVMAILGFSTWFLIVILEHQYGSTIFSMAIIAFSWIGMFAHFTAVAYSFYLSVIESDNDQRERNMTTNNTHDEMQQKNINARLGKMNNDNPPILTSSLSVNENGNQYVEIK